MYICYTLENSANLVMCVLDMSYINSSGMEFNGHVKIERVHFFMRLCGCSLFTWRGLENAFETDFTTYF